MPARRPTRSPRGRWWEAFGDPKLNELETAASRRPIPICTPPSRASSRRARLPIVHARTSSRALGREGVRDPRQELRQRAAVLGSRRHSGDAERFPRGARSGVGNRSVRPAAQYGCLRRGAQAQASAADLAAVQLALQAELATRLLLAARSRRDGAPAARTRSRPTTTRTS